MYYSHEKKNTGSWGKFVLREITRKNIIKTITLYADGMVNIEMVWHVLVKTQSSLNFLGTLNTMVLCKWSAVVCNQMKTFRISNVQIPSFKLRIMEDPHTNYFNHRSGWVLTCILFINFLLMNFESYKKLRFQYPQAKSITNGFAILLMFILSIPYA